MGGAAITRYDGERFTTYAEEDGLAAGGVCAINQDRDGDLWFASGHHGILRGSQRGLLGGIPDT